jgi:hypothetical protein
LGHKPTWKKKGISEAYGPTMPAQKEEEKNKTKKQKRADMGFELAAEHKNNNKNRCWCGALSTCTG